MIMIKYRRTRLTTPGVRGEPSWHWCGSNISKSIVIGMGLVYGDTFAGVDKKDVPLKGEPGDIAVYDGLSSRVRYKNDPSRSDKDRNLREARSYAYRRSAAFANLKPSSQQLYKLVLDRIVERHGHRLVRDARRSDARKIIEEIGAAKPAMANITRAVLRLLMRLRQLGLIGRRRVALNLFQCAMSADRRRFPWLRIQFRPADA